FKPSAYIRPDCSVMNFRNALFLVLFALFCCSASAQNWDTTFYKKYTDKLCVTLTEYGRTFNLGISQKNLDSISTVDYNAESKTGIGVSLDWDIFSVSFGLISIQGDEAHKGKTAYKNISLSFGSTKYFLETAYRRYQGFYDANTPNYDPLFS